MRWWHAHGRFNTRSREGSDAALDTANAMGWMFQHTLPRRERPISNHVFISHCTFQHTLPRRERHQAKERTLGDDMFQHTLPRRERPIYGSTAYYVYKVSTHAPAKGATRPSAPCMNRLRCFNTHSREGSDLFWLTIHSQPTMFQHTLPRRERHAEVAQALNIMIVSTHTPAKGAT